MRRAARSLRDGDARGVEPRHDPGRLHSMASSWTSRIASVRRRDRHAALARLALRVRRCCSSPPRHCRTARASSRRSSRSSSARSPTRSRPTALTRWIVRAAVSGRPRCRRVAPPRWLRAGRRTTATCCEALLALPPPPRAADAGDGGALLQLSLVRAWASSRAALVADDASPTPIARRASSSATPEGRRADAARAWRAGRAATPCSSASRRCWHPSTTDARRPSDTARRRSKPNAARSTSSARRSSAPAIPTRARVARLRDVCAHGTPALAVLAFSESASTVRAYFAAMRADAGVGMLTATRSANRERPLSRATRCSRDSRRARRARRCLMRASASRCCSRPICSRRG